MGNSIQVLAFDDRSIDGIKIERHDKRHYMNVEGSTILLYHTFATWIHKQMSQGDTSTIYLKFETWKE